MAARTFRLSVLLLSYPNKKKIRQYVRGSTGVGRDVPPREGTFPDYKRLAGFRFVRELLYSKTFHRAKGQNLRRKM